MILVVLGHSSSMDILNMCILSFHMPLFFFVSGLTFCVRGGVMDFLLSKLRRIMVPQVTLGVITMLVGVILDVVLCKRISIAEFDFISCFSQWFLIVLFLMYCLFWLIVKYSNKTFLVLTESVLVLLFGVISWNGIYYLQQTICALFFGLLGFLFRPFVDSYNKTIHKCKGMGWLLFLVIAMIAPRQTPILMYNNDYGNKLCFLAIAILGIFASVDVSCAIKRQWFLEWAGKNSIIIFITHFSLLRIYRGIFARIPDPFQLFDNNFFQFLLVTFSEFFIVWFVNKYLPFIIGNKKTFSRVQPQ